MSSSSTNHRDPNSPATSLPPTQSGGSSGIEGNVDHEGEKEPVTGMTFSSEDEVTRYYMNYAQCKGFRVSKISSKNGDDGRKYFTLGCNHARKYVTHRKNVSKPNPIPKEQCKARLNACMCSDGTIIISRVVVEHNHELGPTTQRYYNRSKVLGTRMKRRLELNDQGGTNVRSTFQSLVVEANGFEKEDDTRWLQLGIGDSEAIQNYFVRMQKQDSRFFYLMDVDDRSRLRNIFWADARCRAAHEYFGQVITFDTTYITNKYHMPLVSFVGVNHHGQSVLLGCALLSSESTKTFIWLFATWLECMYGRAPNAIITNHNKAMKNAIELVFPNARRGLCLWHLMEKVPEKLGVHSSYESIKTLLHGVVYDSLSQSDFMERWGKMIEDYELQDNEWLKGIFDERHCWAPVYVRDSFWAGMLITQPSESLNSFFDGYVNSKTTLKQFFERYDNALRDQIERENMADFYSFNTVIACISHFGFEAQFQKAYTNAKFKELQVEVASMMYCNTCFERLEGLKSIFSVVENKKVCDKIEDVVFSVSFNEEDFELHCSCCLFEFTGILCRHVLCVLKLMGKTESVIPYYVLSHWRKDIKRRHTLVKCGFDHLAGHADLQRLDKVCDAFYEVASMGINTDDDLLKVMNWIKDLKIKLTCEETSPRMIEA
ncbi:protein FAR-RED IMPAIRED RESPONSE 1-like [Lotus japonicus]|uniref:protein FAR-RED IMPAIRED RESPONSE 1-like n=1 Tax=Lotus japonicus TaxID=34305 RepID=UPI002586AC04|nr:protein FAR-RED IMPAIRED RESPONSE 1-like [Lotus japonicus]